MANSDLEKMNMRAVPATARKYNRLMEDTHRFISYR